LEQCIRYACDNNIRLKQQELAVFQDENDLSQSKLNVLSNLNASGNFSSSKGKVLDQNTFTLISGKTVIFFREAAAVSVCSRDCNKKIPSTVTCIR